MLGLTNFLIFQNSSFISLWSLTSCPRTIKINKSLLGNSTQSWSQDNRWWARLYTATLSLFLCLSLSHTHTICIYCLCVCIHIRIRIYRCLIFQGPSSSNCISKYAQNFNIYESFIIWIAYVYACGCVCIEEHITELILMLWGVKSRTLLFN